MKEILNESNIFAQQKYNYVDFKLMINDFSFSLSSFFFPCLPMYRTYISVIASLHGKLYFMHY